MADVLGTFEQAVLLALLWPKLNQPKTAPGKESYGRAILKEVQLRLDRQVSAGAVYATLDRLEAKGLISSQTSAGDAGRDGRPRRYYAIEPEGIRALKEARAVAERMWAGVRLPAKGSV